MCVCVCLSPAYLAEDIHEAPANDTDACAPAPQTLQLPLRSHTGLCPSEEPVQ